MINRLLNIKVPDSWEIRELKETSEIIMGQSPPSSTYNNSSDGLPFFQGNADFGYYNPKVRVWCNSPKKIAQPNDILVSVRAPVGAINIADVESCIGRGLSAVRVKNGYDMKYIYYFLNYFNKVFSRLKQGSTFEAITKEELINFPVLLPQNLKEQKRIGSIFYNVDESIFKTQDIINYFQILKKGLMQHLFTEGIGHTELKETRLGKIPKEWEIVTISKIGKVIGGGTPDTRTEKYWNGHITWATPTDITNLNRKFITKTNRNISIEGLNKSSAKLLPPFSLLMTSRASIGYCAINTREMCTNQGFQNIIPNKDIDVEFLYYLIQSSKLQSQLVRFAYGSTFLEIPNKDVKKIKIPLPKLNEQKVIAEILSSTDEKIENEIIYMEKLKIIKKGLMQDLLTGKKRVKIN